MKKLIFAVMAAMISLGCFAAAPSAEMLAKSADRIAKLEKLLEKEPKLCGVGDIDKLQKAVKEAASAAVTNSAIIVKMASEGTQVGDVVALGASVAKEATSVKDAGELVKNATSSLKSINPMKAGGAKKSLSFSQDCLKFLVEESAAQVQMAAELAK